MTTNIYRIGVASELRHEGAFYGYSWGNSGSGTSYNGYGIGFDASRSNAIYTDSGKVYPLSLALNFIIKA